MPNPVIIQPKCTQTFTITFTPFIVLNHKVCLTASIQDMSSNCKPLEIIVRGNSLMPKYHFELEQSDYLSTRRKGKQLCGEETNTSDVRVVEFEAVGLKTPIIR